MKRIISILMTLCLAVGLFAMIPMQASAAGEISITSVNDWMTYLSGKSNISGNYKITATELDFEGKTVEPCTGFSGSLNGNGAVLKNITMEGEADVSLFCDLQQGALIENLVIKSSSFAATNNWVAPIACCTKYDVTIRNIYVDEDVTITSEATENAYAAGILGGVYQSGDSAADVLIENCVFAGTISAKGNYVGGILGSNYNGTSVTIRNCLNIGTVSSAKKYVAGINMTYGTATVTGCVNAGAVSGNDYVAGITSGKPGGAVSVSGCYYIDEKDVDYSTGNNGTVTAENNTKIVATDLIGTNATVTIDGFTKRAGDIMVPTGVASFAPSTASKWSTTYTVKWMNGDEVLAEETYSFGETPTYKGETPTKADDDTYTYTFSAWDPAINAVSEDATYTAVFYKVRKNVVAEEEADDKADDKTAETTAPATTQTEAQTDAPAEEGGCGSVIGAGAFAIVAVMGGAVVLGRKKRD